MKTNAWEKLNAMIYNICLHRCPLVLESFLKANSTWGNISCNHNGIDLLLVIIYITQKQDKKMQIMMSYVKAFLKLSTIFQCAKKTNTRYYEILKSRQDTVTSHGGKPRYHECLYKKLGVAFSEAWG